MKVFKHFALALLIAILSGCEEEKIDLDRFGTISGSVVDSENYEPLSGVLITTNPASNAVLSDENGFFKIDKVKIGDVLINARKDEFLTGSVSIAVYEGENTQLTFFLLDDERNVGNVVLYDPVPGNGAVNQEKDVDLSWKIDQSNRGLELSYSVFIFESGSTSQKIIGENLSSAEATASSLKANTTYFWYVVAKYDGKNVGNSPTWSFRTGS